MHNLGQWAENSEEIALAGLVKMGSAEGMRSALLSGDPELLVQMILYINTRCETCLRSVGVRGEIFPVEET